MSVSVAFIAIAFSLLVGVVAGSLLTWRLTRDHVPPSFQERLQEAQLSKATSEAFLATQRERLREKEKLVEEARNQLSAEFSEHAAKALRSSNEAFLDLATQKFSTLRGEAEGDLKQRKTEVEALVKPLAETLTRFEANLQAIESERQRAYGDLHGLLKGVGEAQDLLRRETANLVSALRRPHVRSRWGELTLRRAAELAGMAEHCDFVEQPTIPTEDGRYRPDMVVQMPGGLSVPVDSKVPLDAYLDAVDARTDEERNASLVRHAKQVRSHMDQLSSKAYWEALDSAPEFTVLFLPGDPFFSAAVDRDPSLVEDAIQHRVLIATPVTLIALLKTVAYGWRQEAVATNARAISEAGREVYERVSIFWGHFSALREALDDAVEAFNKTLGSLRSRLLPSVRRLRELGATTAEEIAETEPIDQVLRSAEPPAEQREEDRGFERQFGATTAEEITETEPIDQVLRSVEPPVGQREEERGFERQFGAITAEEITETEPIDQVLHSAEPPAEQGTEDRGFERQFGAITAEEITETEPIDQVLHSAGPPAEQGTEDRGSERESGTTTAEEITETEPIDQVLHSAEPPAEQGTEDRGSERESGAPTADEVAAKELMDQLLISAEPAAGQGDGDRGSEVN